MYETKKKDTLFDFIFCPGKSYKKLMVDLKIKKKKLIQINPPIFSNYKLLENKNFLEPFYDVMIIGYIPNTRNLDCFYDSNIDTELEILNVCSKLKLKRILIKLKSGTISMQNQQNSSINLYKKLFKKKYNKNLNLLLNFEHGELYNVVNKSKTIIGPFSTSFVEALYNKSKYYVYEPNQNGLTDFELSSNRVCKKKYISRSPSELIKNINSKNYLKVKDNFFSDGNIDSLNKFFEKI